MAFSSAAAKVLPVDLLITTDNTGNASYRDVDGPRCEREVELRRLLTQVYNRTAIVAIEIVSPLHPDAVDKPPTRK